MHGAGSICVVCTWCVCSVFRTLVCLPRQEAYIVYKWSNWAHTCFTEPYIFHPLLALQTQALPLRKKQAKIPRVYQHVLMDLLTLTQFCCEQLMYHQIYAHRWDSELPWWVGRRGDAEEVKPGYYQSQKEPTITHRHTCTHRVNLYDIDS
jgi:hypothetical protein